MHTEIHVSGRLREGDSGYFIFALDGNDMATARPLGSVHVDSGDFCPPDLPKQIKQYRHIDSSVRNITVHCKNPMSESDYAQKHQRFPGNTRPGF